MANAYVQLPDDSANTGKKVRTNSRTVGADSVHEHYNAIIDPTGDITVRVRDVAPTGNEPGLVTRPIISQTVNIQPLGPIGVQVVGYNVGQIGVSGDVSTTPKAGSTWPVQTLNEGTGDGRIVDGANAAIKATVRDYANSNPLAVALTNASGDVFNTQKEPPKYQTAAGRVANQGSNSIVTAVTGKMIKVVGYELQGDGDNARAFFASAASGSRLTAEWERASREGVVRSAGGGERAFLFATSTAAALSLECSSARGIKYSVTYHVEDAN